MKEIARGEKGRTTFIESPARFVLVKATRTLEQHLELLNSSIRSPLLENPTQFQVLGRDGAFSMRGHDHVAVFLGYGQEMRFQDIPALR